MAPAWQFSAGGKEALGLSKGVSNQLDRPEEYLAEVSVV